MEGGRCGWRFPVGASSPGRVAHALWLALALVRVLKASHCTENPLRSASSAKDAQEDADARATSAPASASASETVVSPQPPTRMYMRKPCALTRAIC